MPYQTDSITNALRLLRVGYNRATWRGFGGGLQMNRSRTVTTSLSATLILSLGCLAAIFSARTGALAQNPRPSQHGSVSQQIADTKITIDYNRPVARGREIFGKLVRWGEVWCPGADQASS